MVVGVDEHIPDPKQEADPFRREGMERALDYMGLEADMPIIDIAVDKIFIGSSTNGRLAHLRAADDVVRGHKPADNITVAMVVPGSGIVKPCAQGGCSGGVPAPLYQPLEGHGDDLVAKLFAQWQLFFSEVSGYDEASTRRRGKKGLRQFARGMGLLPETTDPPRLFFAIHTYFSFLVKAIARLVLERHAGGTLGTTPLTVLANLEGEALRYDLRQMEGGGIFRALGLQNLLEGDFFAWYLQAWSDQVEEALKLTLARLAEYNPATIEEDPFAARDPLKKLYHYLLPRELRHDLGEYYTPDWLAERVLRQLGEPLLVMPEPVIRRRVNLARPPRLLESG